MKDYLILLLSACVPLLANKQDNFISEAMRIKESFSEYKQGNLYPTQVLMNNCSKIQMPAGLKQLGHSFFRPLTLARITKWHSDQIDIRERYVLGQFKDLYPVTKTEFQKVCDNPKILEELPIYYCYASSMSDEARNRTDSDKRQLLSNYNHTGSQYYCFQNRLLVFINSKNEKTAFTFYGSLTRWNRKQD